MTPRVTRFSLSVRAVIGANGTVVTAAASASANSSYEHLAADTKLPRLAGKTIASGSNPTGSADVSPA